VRTGDSKVMHHLSRFDTGDRSIEHVNWLLDVAFVGRVICRLDDGIMDVGREEG